MSGVLLVISSPSGAGKSSIAKRLLDRRSDLEYSVSATTRPRRPTEVAGRSYHFLTRPEFEERIAAGQFLEWATYNGHLYGTLATEVNSRLTVGRSVILDIEVQGARQLRRSYPDSIQIFVLPPSGAALVERLCGRRTEEPAVVCQRLLLAADELLEAASYDYVVINDDLDRAVAEIEAILEAERHRPKRLADLDNFIAKVQREILAYADQNMAPEAPQTR